MNKLIIGITGCLISALWCGPAAAWASANRYGGSTEHVAGVGTEHTNAYGGSSEHAYGGGSEHTSMYGGNTAGKYVEGAEHKDHKAQSVAPQSDAPGACNLEESA
jgi:hypothetical protein